MKRVFGMLILAIFLQPCFAETINGNIEKNGERQMNEVVDSTSHKPIPFATIKIPTKNFMTKTDEYGKFYLNADINGATIMSVEKSGYKPFSITISEKNLDKPIVIGIEKTQMTDLSLESDIIHLGDNNYSANSANSREFRLRSVGPYYTKTFKISNINSNENVYFVIGSVIGIDTLVARQLGQTKVTTAYSSPAQIYFNGQKIAEIKFNGDGQQILLPKQLIRINANNEITIKTGKNLFQTAYTDYDDIEIANLHIEYKPTIANEY